MASAMRPARTTSTYTSTSQQLMLRVKVDPATLDPAGLPEFIAGGRQWDDFVIDEAREVAYVTTHRENTIDRVRLAPDGNREGRTIVAGDPFSDLLVGPSSAAWGRAAGDARPRRLRHHGWRHGEVARRRGPNRQAASRHLPGSRQGLKRETIGLGCHTRGRDHGRYRGTHRAHEGMRHLPVGIASRCKGARHEPSGSDGQRRCASLHAITRASNAADRPRPHTHSQPPPGPERPDQRGHERAPP